LSNGRLFSNQCGSIKERTQTSTKMGSDQSAVRSLPCHNVHIMAEWDERNKHVIGDAVRQSADWSLPISVLVATGRGRAGTAHAQIRQLANYHNKK